MTEFRSLLAKVLAVVLINCLLLSSYRSVNCPTAQLSFTIVKDLVYYRQFGFLGVTILLFALIKFSIFSQVPSCHLLCAGYGTTSVE
jgi:hypothetical protein